MSSTEIPPMFEVLVNLLIGFGSTLFTLSGDAFPFEQARTLYYVLALCVTPVLIRYVPFWSCVQLLLSVFGAKLGLNLYRAVLFSEKRRMN